MELIKEVRKELHEIAQLSNINGLLSWDMEVMMPKGADKVYRGSQRALISGMLFERGTSNELEEKVDKILNFSDLDSGVRLDFEKIKRGIGKRKKLNKDFVQKYTETTSKAHSVWIEARKQSDFTVYKDSLSQVVDMLLEKADLLGYEDHPFDALADDYDQGMNVKQLDVLFKDVQEQLKPMIQSRLDSQNEYKGIFTQKFEIEKQKLFVKDVLDLLEMNDGIYRIDVSAHPFCTHFHPTDIRMTTRYDENDLMNCIWSAIHESGHGRYEMGLNKDEIGMPLSDSSSLSIHESQSRFWENNICRSREFMEHLLPLLKKHFPQQFKNTNTQELFDEANYVKPSLIRTESDELTYHYHIMIRYEVEKKLMSRELKVKDVRDYWNEMYDKYLDIKVPNDAEGVLQDVHWSFGGLGYFPTYSLGSFYAAQWNGNMENVKELIKSKKFNKINDWHQKNIHDLGARYTSEEICKKATGEELNFKFFKKYIEEKFYI